MTDDKSPVEVARKIIADNNKKYDNAIKELNEKYDLLSEKYIKANQTIIELQEKLIKIQSEVGAK